MSIVNKNFKSNLSILKKSKAFRNLRNNHLTSLGNRLFLVSHER